MRLLGVNRAVILRFRSCERGKNEVERCRDGLGINMRIKRCPGEGERATIDGLDGRLPRRVLRPAAVARSRHLASTKDGGVEGGKSYCQRPASQAVGFATVRSSTRTSAATSAQTALMDRAWKVSVRSAAVAENGMRGTSRGFSPGFSK